jgi:hypothetical protein
LELKRLSKAAFLSIVSEHLHRRRILVHFSTYISTVASWQREGKKRRFANWVDD